MKTAEEWMKELPEELDGDIMNMVVGAETYRKTITPEFIKAIQLDAHNSAVRECIQKIGKVAAETGDSTPDERAFVRHANIHIKELCELLKPT